MGHIYRPITLRFIRRTASGAANPDPRTDDHLRIVKLRENWVRVTYVDVHDGLAISDTNNMTYAQLNMYVYRIFWLVALDDDPFKSVQLFIPGYPTVLLDVARLQQVIPQLLELLGASYNTWPLIVPPRITASAARGPVAGPQETANGADNQDGTNGVSSTT